MFLKPYDLLVLLRKKLDLILGVNHPGTAKKVKVSGM